jgi:hypothetical protein
MDLQNLWFVLIVVLWSGYFLLEGFDFGVGMLLPFLPRVDDERGAMFASIGPVWDGNEVWLVVAAGATFAAFPAWYATLFSGFYVALLLILVLLIVRVISFEWREKDAPRRVGSTVWSIMDATSRYFAPSRERFMVNYRVANLDRVLAALKREGIDAKREDSEFGRFAWIFDPEGRKLELWEPPAPKKKSKKNTVRKKKSASRRRA